MMYLKILNEDESESTNSQRETARKIGRAIGRGAKYYGLARLITAPLRMWKRAKNKKEKEARKQGIINDLESKLQSGEISKEEYVTAMKTLRATGM